MIERLKSENRRKYRGTQNEIRLPQKDLNLETQNLGNQNLGLKYT